jgi:uncharacterized protein YcbK (DUF882 family)
MSRSDRPILTSSPEIGPERPDRRRFLHRAASAVVALAPMGAAWGRALEQRSPSAVQRSLSFVHTHTGESLSTVYYEGGSYLTPELHRVNRLLRDFRTGDVHPIDPSLLDILFELRTLADPEQPFEVISGYRSPKTNAFLRQHSSGVAEHSLHIQGRAIDIRMSGFPTRKLRELALGMRRGGVGFYPTSDFVHVDNGRVRFW